MNCSANTLKRWFIDYEKNPSILITLEAKCSGTRRAQRHGHLNQRQTRLTYSEDIDMDLYDWVMCLLDMGVALTRGDIKDKAREMIQLEKSDFK